MKDYIIKTERLGLRKWKTEDLVPFAEMNSDSKVMEFFPNTLTKEESDTFANRIIRNFNAHGFGLYAVDELSSDEFVAVSIDWTQSPLTYWSYEAYLQYREGAIGSIIYISWSGFKRPDSNPERNPLPEKSTGKKESVG